MDAWAGNRAHVWFEVQYPNHCLFRGKDFFLEVRSAPQMFASCQQLGNVDAAELKMGAAKMKVSSLLTTGSPGGPSTHGGAGRGACAADTCVLRDGSVFLSNWLMT